MDLVFAELSKLIPVFCHTSPNESERFPIAELIMSYYNYPLVEHLFASISSLRELRGYGEIANVRVLPLRVYDIQRGAGVWLQTTYVESRYLGQGVTLNGETILKDNGETCEGMVEYYPFTGHRSMKVSGGFRYIGMFFNHSQNIQTIYIGDNDLDYLY